MQCNPFFLILSYVILCTVPYIHVVHTYICSTVHTHTYVYTCRRFLGPCVDHLRWIGTRPKRTNPWVKVSPWQVKNYTQMQQPMGQYRPLYEASHLGRKTNPCNETTAEEEPYLRVKCMFVRCPTYLHLYPCTLPTAPVSRPVSPHLDDSCPHSLKLYLKIDRIRFNTQNRGFFSF